MSHFSKKFLKFSFIFLALFIITTVIFKKTDVMAASQTSKQPTTAMNVPEIWVHVNAHTELNNDPSAEWRTIFANTSNWSTLLGYTDVYQFFQRAIPGFTSTALQQAVSTFSNQGILVAIESIGLDIYSCHNYQSSPLNDRIYRSAEFSANSFLSDIAPLVSAGGTVTYVALDFTGIGHVLGSNQGNHCNFNVANATQALIQMMGRIHDVYPNIKFGLLPNFPNYNYGGTPCYFNTTSSSACLAALGNVDYESVLSSMVSDIRSAGEDVYFVHVDNPYDYQSGHYGSVNVMRQRILPLKEQTESLGMRFGLILNSELHAEVAAGQTASQLNAAYKTQTLASLSNLTTAGGATASDFIIESWYTHPFSILPESTSNTFTNTAKDTASTILSTIASTSSVSVYRLSKTGSFFYTTSTAERDAAINSYGYSLNGVAFNENTNPMTARKAVFRLNNASGDYLYTTNTYEVNVAIASYGYTYNGVAFYAPPADANCSSPVYRLVKSGVHFYTSSATEKNTAVSSLGYTLEGNAFCVAP